MRRMGLEWLFRLLVEPRRLWYRYLVYNPWFVHTVASSRNGSGLRRSQPAKLADAREGGASAPTQSAAARQHHERRQDRAPAADR